MNKTIVTSLLVLGVATTAFADRGSRYERGGGLPVPPGFSKTRGGLPVPPGIPKALVPGGRHSILPAPRIPSVPVPVPVVGFSGRYRSRGYAQHHYNSAPVYVAPPPRVVCAPAPVIVHPATVYVAPAPVVYVAPPVYVAPVTVWNPPVCQPRYYRGSSVSVSFSYQN